jgi:sugar/nucleoside kinase (ribokinase family)
MKQIIVIGDLNLDIIFSGLKDYPSHGKEIAAEHCLKKAGGSAANAALVLAANGYPVRLYSRVGGDHDGVFVLNYLKARGIKTDTITLSEAESTGMTVSLTYPGERMYISHLGTVATTTLEDLCGGYIKPGAHLHLASYFLQKGLQPSMGKLLEDARNAGMSTSFDPGSDPEGKWNMSVLGEYLKYIDWFLPNDDEIKALAETEDLKEALRKFPPQVRGIVIKAGEDGAICRFQGSIEHYPASRVRVVDRTCAGDSFNAGFLIGITGDLTLPEAIRLGNRFGAEAVSCPGLPLHRLVE